MTSSSAIDLIKRAGEEISAGRTGNRFLDLLEAGAVPRERLTWIAGEEYHIVRSDRRSFALLAARFPDAAAGEMFLSLAQGEAQALGLLIDYAAALGWAEKDLAAYEPRPAAQAYPAYLGWCAAFGSGSGVALAMLSNLDEWGEYCGRAAEALRSQYDLSEQAVAFFEFFAATPPGFTEQATAVIDAGLAAGEDPVDALRAARTVHAYETAFWQALATGLE